MQVRTQAIANKGWRRQETVCIDYPKKATFAGKKFKGK